VAALGRRGETTGSGKHAQVLEFGRDEEDSHVIEGVLTTLTKKSSGVAV